eukprot:Gb_19547 [translate_table: standard]
MMRIVALGPACNLRSMQQIAQWQMMLVILVTFPLLITATIALLAIQYVLFDGSHEQGHSIVCMARTFLDLANQGGACILFNTHFQNAWNDLVVEGLIEGKRRDTFNVLVFAPTVEEFRDVVEREGSFGVERVEVFQSWKSSSCEVGRR